MPTREAASAKRETTVYGDPAKTRGVSLSVKTLAKLGTDLFSEMGFDFETEIHFNKERGKEGPRYQEYDLGTLHRFLSALQKIAPEDSRPNVHLGFLSDGSSENYALVLYVPEQEDELKFYIAPRAIEKPKEKS